MKKLGHTSTMSALALCGLFGSAASGAVLNVDIGDDIKTDGNTYVGLAGAPDPVGATAIWNDVTYGFPAFTGTSLLFSDGTASSILFTVSKTQSFGGGNGNGSWVGGFEDPPNTTEPLPNRLVIDRAVRAVALAPDPQPELTFQVANLNPAHIYSVYLYDGPGVTNFYTLGGETRKATSSTIYDDGTLGANVPPAIVSNSWIEGDHYVVFSGITGVALIDVTINDWGGGPTPLTANEGYGPANRRGVGLAGFQLVEVIPEPSAVTVLCAAAGLTLLRRRRVT